VVKKKTGNQNTAISNESTALTNKNKHRNWAGGVAEMVEGLPSIQRP
jgi:hypothetical protein